MINRITLVAAFIGILAIGSWVFTLLDSEEGDYAYGRPAGNLTLGIQLRNSSIGYVSDGGLGELIQINVSMKSKGDTWESVYELGNSDTDTDSKLFCVWVDGRLYTVASPYWRSNKGRRPLECGCAGAFPTQYAASAGIKCERHECELT